jgi:hypothetical protein
MFPISRCTVSSVRCDQQSKSDLPTTHYGSLEGSSTSQEDQPSDSNVVGKRSNEDGLLESFNRPEVFHCFYNLDKGFMTLEAAFHHHILSKCKTPSEYKLTDQILNHHSKTKAWREGTSKLKGRDPNESTINEDIRTPLPFKVQHRYSTKSDDPFFYGIKHIQHADGTKWLAACRAVCGIQR